MLFPGLAWVFVPCDDEAMSRADGEDDGGDDDDDDDFGDDD